MALKIDLDHYKIG